MSTVIHWRLMFRVNDREAFNRCLSRALPHLGLQCDATPGQQYWKIPALWECTVTAPTAGGSAADHVLECLIAAYKLAAGWHIMGSLSVESAVGFSGVMAVGNGGGSGHVPGLEWASFSIISRPEDV